MNCKKCNARDGIIKKHDRNCPFNNEPVTLRNEIKNKHEHTFKTGLSNKVETCYCGKFRFINLSPDDIITEVK